MVYKVLFLVLFSTYMSIPCMSVKPANSPFLRERDPPMYVAISDSFSHNESVVLIKLRT